MYKAKAERSKDEMRLAAFVSYHIYAANSDPKDRLTMKAYFDQFGLNEEGIPSSVQSEEESERISEMVRNAFKKK
jgi:hypothetical protein